MSLEAQYLCGVVSFSRALEVKYNVMNAAAVFSGPNWFTDYGLPGVPVTIAVNR